MKTFMIKEFLIVYRSVNWLFSRIEWHLLANHLFVNAKALMHWNFFFKSLKVGCLREEF